MVKEAPAMSAEDKKWRARSDADTLMQAQEIHGDRARFKAAMAEIGRREKEIKAVKSGAGKVPAALS
ncbi:MAG TPA: hypothetical protein VMZ92_09230 [Planctomycetota bacterium]|nr:hypothetical protein [Planctomycetota bacterium]